MRVCDVTQVDGSEVVDTSQLQTEYKQLETYDHNRSIKYLSFQTKTGQFLNTLNTVELSLAHSRKSILLHTHTCHTLHFVLNNLV